MPKINYPRFSEPPDEGTPPICDECQEENCPDVCKKLNSFLIERERLITEQERKMFKDKMMLKDYIGNMRRWARLGWSVWKAVDKHEDN